MAQQARLVGRWLQQSNEHTNFTYPLSELNMEHLAWWISSVTGADVDHAWELMKELEQDAAFTAHVQTAVRSHRRGRFADEDVHLHKRLGWYALARLKQPLVMVETGTDKGLGSLVLAAAAMRNGRGHVVTIDINSDAGYMIRPPFDAYIDRRVGSSLDVLSSLDAPVDFFLHDSLHTEEHEAAELRAVTGVLTEDAYVLSDYAHASRALPDWAKKHGYRFSFFAEAPRSHWFRGEGIGLAYRS